MVKHKVAWAAIRIESGDLEDEKIRQKIRSLLDDFGAILEEEAKVAGVDVFTYPLFREFNLFAALTADEVLCAIAPNVGGLSRFLWFDWQNRHEPPKGRDLASAIHRELSWESVSVFSFPKPLLDQEPQIRASALRDIAKSWVEQTIREIERQARVMRINPIFKGRDFLVEDDLCFVLMPLREPFIRIYENHVKPTLQKMGFRVIKADDIFTPTAIIDDIWQYINRARLIIADVTGRNSNVFYELGICHTVGKDVIILTQNEDDVPFDLRHLRYFKYVDNEEGWQVLRKNLEKAISAVLGK